MARTLSQGMTGQDVRALQDALNYQIRRGTPLGLQGVFWATAACVRSRLHCQSCGTPTCRKYCGDVRAPGFKPR